MAFKHYFYNEQIRKYLLQFGNLMSGLRVRTGKRENGQSIFVTVPIKYASQDRMAQALQQTHGSGSPETMDKVRVSLPVMSFDMISILPRPESRRHLNIIDRRSYVTVEDAIDSANPTEMASKIRVLARSMPVPYTLSVELHLYASNTDQHLQMLEQLLMIFNPELMIQTTDKAWDWTALTSIKLVDVALEEEIPVGTNDRVIQSTLIFDIPVWISGPMKEVTNGHVGAVRMVIRDATEYTGSLDDLTIGDEVGTIPGGITSTGISIDIIGTPTESIVDVTTDENGVSSGQTLPPKSDYNV